MVGGAIWRDSADAVFQELVASGEPLKLGPVELLYVKRVPYDGVAYELGQTGLWLIAPDFAYRESPALKVLQPHGFLHLAPPAGARAAFDALLSTFVGVDVLPIRTQPRVGGLITVISVPGTSDDELLGKRGAIVGIDPLPEYEGGEFWRVRLEGNRSDGDSGAYEVDWHHSCFLLEPTWLHYPMVESKLFLNDPQGELSLEMSKSRYRRIRTAGDRIFMVPDREEGRS